MLKAQVTHAIASLIHERALTQRAAGAKIGIAQPDVSKLLSGRFDGFSLERLLGFLRALGSDVAISVTPARDVSREGKLSVTIG